MRDELEALSSKVEGQISQHQKIRDEWNSKVVEFKARRDSVSGQKRELFSEIERQRTIRDQENRNARDGKSLRSELNEKFAEAKRKRDRVVGGSKQRRGEDPQSLKKEMDDLENRFMTGRFSGTEREFNDKMKRLSRKRKELQSSSHLSGEQKNAQDQFLSIHAKLEETHKEVLRAAEAAQTAHDLMLKLMDEKDRLTGTHDSAHEQFVEAVKNSDKHHRQYIVAMRCVYSIRNILKASEDRLAGHEPTRVQSRPEAQDLMSALMSGKTLSAEQIMAIQKKK